jgi:hypothetical protein
MCTGNRKAHALVIGQSDVDESGNRLHYRRMLAACDKKLHAALVVGEPARRIHAAKLAFLQDRLGLWVVD